VARPAGQLPEDAVTVPDSACAAP